MIKHKVLVRKDDPERAGRLHTSPVQTSPPALRNQHSVNRQVQTLSHKLFASHLPAEDYLLKKFANNSADQTGKRFLQGRRNRGAEEQQLCQHRTAKARAERQRGAHHLVQLISQ